MKPNLLRQGIFASLVIAATTAVAGPRGYLPQAGPTPLRYASLTKPVPAPLPPLPEPTVPKAPDEPTTGEPTPPAPAEPVTVLEERQIPAPQPEPTAIVEPAPEPEPEPESAAPEVRVTPSPAALSPQQLITYFTARPDPKPRPTRPAVTPTVVAPVTFVPPPPSQKSVSQATYTRGN